MKNTKKVSANVLLVIIIIILLATVGYFAFVKKPTIAVQQDTVTTEIPNQTLSADERILKIDSVLPTSVTIGTSITINGKGFSIQNPVKRTGMSSIPSDAVVNIQDTTGQNIPVFTLHQGVSHSDNLITFVLPSKICKYSERGCGGSDPASSYYHILPGVYKLSVVVPNTDYFSNSINITVK